MHALSKRRTKPVFVSKSEIKVIRPARVPGDKQRFHAELFQARFQFRQGANRQLVVLRQRGNEAVSAVRAKPDRVACVREWVANIFFYRKGGKTIMIDAGYNYDRLEEKMGWLGIDPKSIRDILITHQDTDHVGAVEADSPGLFRQARLYVGEIENRYLTGEVRRKVIYHLYKLPKVTINNEKVQLESIVNATICS